MSAGVTKPRYRLLLILVVVVLQWVIYLMMGYDSQTGIWTPVHPDTMNTLMMARTLAHGHPLQLLPGDPPSTMLSDLLSPLLFSGGYWLGFRSPSSFILWAYIECLIIALCSAYFIWRFHKRSIPEVAFPATLLSMIFTGIFSNIFHTNFGFFFVFFWGALAFIDSFPLFILFSILAGLTRPEGIMVYLLLVLLFSTTHGKSRLWRFLPGLLPLLIPPLLYKILTGSFVSQGVGPQNIVQYEGFGGSIAVAFSGITDQIKGGILGIFPTSAKIGSEGSGWLGSFPPFLFILALLGLAKYKKWWLAILSSYLLIAIVGDSFTLFSAAHQNRHISFMAPFFFGFALWFVRGIQIRGISLYVPMTVFFSLMLGLQFFGAIPGQRNVKAQIACDKQITDHLLSEWSETEVLDASYSVSYWADRRLKCHTLSPASNPYLGAYVRSYFRPLEISELVQKLYPTRVAFVSYYENSLTERWFSQFTTQQLKSCMRRYKNIAEARLLDLSKIKDQAPYGDPYSELDVGDPSSEIACRYKFRDSLERPLGSFLMEGDGFWDGGRPGIIAEEFDLPVPENGGTLVCRYRGSFQGNILEEFDKSPVALSVRRSRLRVAADGIEVFNGVVSLEEGFTYLEIPLAYGGVVHFDMEGAVHSFHYWVYPEFAMDQAAITSG